MEIFPKIPFHKKSYKLNHGIELNCNLIYDRKQRYTKGAVGVLHFLSMGRKDS